MRDGKHRLLCIQRPLDRLGNGQRAILRQIGDVTVTNIEADPLMTLMTGVQNFKAFSAADQHQIVGKTAQASEHHVLVRRQRPPRDHRGAPFELQNPNIVAMDRRSRFSSRRSYRHLTCSQNNQNFGRP
jgi:hypothetical protein